MDIKSCASGYELVPDYWRAERGCCTEQTFAFLPSTALLAPSYDASDGGQCERQEDEQDGLWAAWHRHFPCLSESRLLVSEPKHHIAGALIGSKELISAVPFNDRLLAVITEMSRRVNFS